MELFFVFVKMNSEKVKRKFLTLEKKAEILKDLDKGLSVSVLSRKYAIGKSSICAIKDRKEKILSAISHTIGSSKRKTLRESEFPETEKKLFTWFLSQRAKGFPVTAEILKSKAREIQLHIKENGEQFAASDGWLQKFRKRFGIRRLKISGEKLSSDVGAVEPFKHELRMTMRRLNLNEHQVYNADETALFWRLLPDKTYVSLNEMSAQGMKNSKERVTILACTNASGEHKLIPLVIGKAKQPRSFKNFKSPVLYTHSKRAWMTKEIFKDWFMNNFIPEVKQFLGRRRLPIKAVLILDNATSHGPNETLQSSDGSIRVMFLPANVTPLIQPLDQNVLRLMKLHYRNTLLTAILAESSDNIVRALKKLTLRDAVLNLHIAWNKLDAQTISKCWSKILTGITEEYDSEDDIPLNQLIQRWNNQSSEDTVISTTISLLEALDSNGTYTVDDVENWVTDSAEQTMMEFSDSEEEEINNNTQKEISTYDAIKALNLVIDWAENVDADTEEILALRNLRTKAVLMCSEKKKQTKLTSYFQKI